MIYGERFERFEYERPFFYNLPPNGRNSGGGARRRIQRRNDNTNTLRNNVRRVIEANASCREQIPKFITYTFAENITDIDIALRRWSSYQKTMRRRFGKLKYVSVVEFQKRGAVHFHVLYFNLPYVPRLKEVIAKTWDVGFTQVKAIRSVRSLASYVSKYMTKDIDPRLNGRKAYFTSKNLVRPFTIRGEEKVDQMTRSGRFESETVRQYESSRLGTITHTIGKIHEIPIQITVA